MIDTDKYKCPHCKTEYDENDVWHDVIDLQLWKTTSICEGCFEEDGGSRYMNSTDVESLTSEVKRLRDGIQYWFDTIAHMEDDVMVQYFKRLIE
jgi:hypothetical protein